MKNLTKLILFTAAICLGTNNLFANTSGPATQDSATAVTAVESVKFTEQPVAVPTNEITRISLDFKDAEIATVLRVISLKSGINIVSGPEVVGMVTIRLEEVEWQKALDVILRTYNYVYEKDDNVIRVTTREKMQLEPVDTKTFILNYSKAAEVQGSVQDILTERGRVKLSERMNMLIVTDIPSNIFQIGQVIEKIDQPTAQAYIDSMIINTREGASEDLGISWDTQGSLTGAARPTTFPFPQTGEGTDFGSAIDQFFPVTQSNAIDNLTNPSANRQFPISPAQEAANNTYSLGTLSFSNFQAVLKMLKTDTQTKVVSNPRIVVLNNQAAEIQVGTEVPLPSYERNENTGSMEVSGFSFRDVGVVLKVTPHINNANEIMVDLEPEVSSQGANVSFQADFQAPSFNVTQAKTQVMMKSGETIAIGGLLTDNEDTTETKVPYLGDIPVIGKIFFKAKRQTSGAGNQKQETLFFVTVTSVDTSGQPVETNANQDNTSSQDSTSQAGS